MTESSSPAPSLLQPAPPDLATVRREDSRRVVEAMEQWRRRSRLIGFFRLALPAAIGLVVLGTGAWVATRTILAGMADQAARNAEIRMTNPRFYGQDADGRSFILGSAEAIQEGGRQRIRLIRPLLRLDASGEQPTEASALNGTYEEASRRVHLVNEVVVVDGVSGFRFETEAALVDTASGVISGDSAIRGRGRQGTIDASSWAIYDHGRRMVFRGEGENKVRAVINNP